jgi:hypothetical protein
VEPLEHFQENRAVIEDFSSRTLAAIHTDFARLHYVSSLKDCATGRYEHEGLMSLYPENSVQSGLAHCHEELFSRILETPLQRQESDLRACLETAGDQFWNVVENWRENQSIDEMCPQEVPGYLQDMFRSNMCALLAIFSAHKPS